MKSGFKNITRACLAGRDAWRGKRESVSMGKCITMGSGEFLVGFT